VLSIENEMTSDSELLRRFAKTNSEDAFAELVKRHVNLVYSAALRQVGGDAQLAQDAAQTVFADLARKAGELSRRQSLTGWLYTSARFAAAKIARTENRRRDREEKFMREPTNESGAGFQPASSASEADWEKIRPALDDAMHELNEADREAILFRYFENQPFIQVGAKFGLNENAARMRVERALEKLRAIFAKRGITAAAALASAISANAVQLAPANLAATLTAGSLAAAGTGTFTFMKIMSMTNLKLGLGALAVAGAASAMVMQHQTQNQLRDTNASLRQQITQLKTDNQSLSNRLAVVGPAKSLTDEQFNELMRLRGEVGLLKQRTNQLGSLEQRERQQYQQSLASIRQHQTEQYSPEDLFQLHQFHVIDAMKQIGLAMRIYANDHGWQLATSFGQLKNELGNVTNINGVSLDSLEFVNVGLVNYTMPEMIIFREREPRQNPQGGWSREYGLANGSVQTVYGNSPDDKSFSTFEAQHSPPPNQ
jgi:RNA polymerase sigma factor (sigma-70 family)